MSKEKNKIATRTEEQIVAGAPIEVILGGKKYKIAPLVIREAREWRKHYAEVTAPLFSVVNATMESAEQFGDIYKKMLTSMPDETIDLFFEYAKDLDRDEIESIATEYELAKAWENLVEIALPLTESLPKAMGRLSR